MKNTTWPGHCTVERVKSVTKGATAKVRCCLSALLKHLKATYRRAKTITLIVDKYIIHKSHETQRWLKVNPKFRVIYQLVYSPWVNHVERLWQALHDTITRNHQCRSMWQLVKKVRHFRKPPVHSLEGYMVWQKCSDIMRSYLEVFRLCCMIWGEKVSLPWEMATASSCHWGQSVRKRTGIYWATNN